MGLDYFVGDGYGEENIDPQRFMNAIEREYLRREASHITTYTGQPSASTTHKLILLT